MCYLEQYLRIADPTYETTSYRYNTPMCSVDTFFINLLTRRDSNCLSSISQFTDWELLPYLKICCYITKKRCTLM